MTDSIIHNFASKEGIEPSKIEEMIYEFLTTFIRGGRSFGKEDKFNVKEFLTGISVENEHINVDSQSNWNKLIATKISSDHLHECEKYYSYLSEMEKKCKGENNG